MRHISVWWRRIPRSLNSLQFVLFIHFHLTSFLHSVLNKMSSFDVGNSSEINYTFYKNKHVSIISCPFSGGQHRGGVEYGPLHVLEHGLENQLKSLDWTVSSVNELEFTPPKSDPDEGKLKRPRFVSEATKKVATEVAASVKAGTFALTIGGDHSLAIGTVSGVFSQFPDACLLWIDAHADINTAQTTESGNIHGCPVSFLMGLNDPCPPQFEWVKPVLKANKLAYIGLRDVDPGERMILKQHNIAAYSMHHVDKYGIGKVVEMALARINPEGKSPVHLSLDIDALDPEHAPATGTPVRGGLSLREACYICEAVAETGNLVSMDLMECNPVLGVDERSIKSTMDTACSLVRCAMGETLL
ncbi:hypothetical protein V1512DRAFT_262399 [Lipomyces arxii]|uniref:uncharacterized protein n=1 Tax=Lipomyces arxii TaxID=56418 RepID=UPI0034CD3A7D